MLKDRRVLVEAEITKLTNIAAQMYLDVAVRGLVIDDAKYQSVQSRITDLQHEHKMINILIQRNHE